jgi:hypothetical protein
MVDTNNLRLKVERAIRDLVAERLLNETVNCIMQILEDEKQDSYDEGYQEGYTNGNEGH